MSSLHRLSLVLGASLERARECAAFMDWLNAEVRPRRAVLFVTAPGGESLHPAAVRGFRKPPRGDLPVGHDPWAWLEAQKISLPRGERYSLPIVLEGEFFGLLAVIGAQQGEALTEEQRRLKPALAYLASILRNIERYENIERLVEERTARLRQSEERFHLLAESSLTGIYLIQDGRFRYVNRALANTFGYEVEEVVDKLGPLDLTHPADHRMVQENLRRRVAGEVESIRYEFRGLRKDGGVIDIEVHGRRIEYEGRPAVIGTLVDVTERRQAEEALRESEEKYRTLIEQLPAIVYVDKLDGKGTTLFISPQVETILGISVEEWLKGDSSLWLNLIHPEDRPRALDAYQASVESGQSYEIEYRALSREGRWIWLHDKGTVLRGSEGELLLHGVMFDVTERRHHERQLEAQAMLAQALGESLELQPLLERLLEAARHAIPAAEKGSILLLEADGRLRIRALNGYSDPRLKEFTFAGDSGYSARAARERRPLLIANVRADPEIRYDGEIEEARQIHSAIAVPLRIQERVIGVLSLDSTQKEAFTQEDLNHLVSFASPAALVIENARLFEDTQARLRELEAIQSLSTALRRAHTVREMLPILIRDAAQAVEADAGSIYLWEEAGDEWVSQGWITAEGNWVPASGELRHRRGEGLTGQVGESGQPYITTDWRADPTNQPLPSELEFLQRLTSGISLPLKAEARVVGVMHLAYTTSHTFTHAQQRLLTAIADMAGNAIQRARLHEETQRRLEQLQSLQAIDQAITASLDLRLSLNILLERAAAVLRADALGILLYNSNTMDLEYAAGRGFETRLYEHCRLRLGEGQAGRAALERSLVVVPDLSACDPPFVHVELRQGERFVSYAAAPLFAKGQLKGVLDVFFRRPFRADGEWLRLCETLAGQAAIAIDNAQLFEGLQRSHLELGLAYDEAIEGWSRALDLRDKETEGHTQRVTELTLKLARAMGLTNSELVHIRRGALLHDIGKMGVPDSILLKPGPLSEEEWAIMRRHPQFAYEMLSPIDYLRPALDIPHCHHERWDGTGYPQGLKGEQIPLPARLFAVVDVYDALTSDRPYRVAWPKEKALEYIRRQSGAHFDPQVVEKFMELIAEDRGQRAREWGNGQGDKDFPIIGGNLRLI